MRSVISESYRPLELICIDDGSTDDTAKLLKNFETILKESGVQYTVLTQENIGPVSYTHLDVYKRQLHLHRALVRQKLDEPPYRTAQQAHAPAASPARRPSAYQRKSERRRLKRNRKNCFLFCRLWKLAGQSAALSDCWKRSKTKACRSPFFCTAARENS